MGDISMFKLSEMGEKKIHILVLKTYFVEKKSIAWSIVPSSAT